MKFNHRSKTKSKKQEQKISGHKNCTPAISTFSGFFFFGFLASGFWVVFLVSNHHYSFRSMIINYKNYFSVERKNNNKTLYRKLLHRKLSLLFRLAPEA